MELNIPENDTVGKMALVYFDGLRRQKTELERQLNTLKGEIRLCQMALEENYGVPRYPKSSPGTDQDGLDVACASQAAEQTG